MIKVLETGLVYRNPAPHIRAVHAWHPSLVSVGERDLYCGFDLGQAVESLDYATYFSHSDDDGHTWSTPQRLFSDHVSRPTTHTVRLSHPEPGKIVGFGGRFYRDNPNEGLTKRSNLGFVEMDLITVRASEQLNAWLQPQTIQPPLVGPAFEICHAILRLADGRWLAPTSTWRGWDGECPNGMKAVALVSYDGGATWPEYLDVMDGSVAGILYLEQSLTQLPDGRLLAVTWAYHEASGETKPTPYAISEDGRSFGEPRSTGLNAQTAKVLCLPDGRILTVYRANGRRGLWANISRLDGNQWVNTEEAALWQGAGSGMEGRANASDELSILKFGFPSLITRPNGDVLVVFWCYEDEVYHIRWIRLRP